MSSAHVLIDNNGFCPNFFQIFVHFLNEKKTIYVERTKKPPVIENLTQIRVSYASSFIYLWKYSNMFDVHGIRDF